MNPEHGRKFALLRKRMIMIEDDQKNSIAKNA